MTSEDNIIFIGRGAPTLAGSNGISATLRTDDERSIADPICDLGQLAEERGFDFVSEIRRVIRHWFAELHAQDGNLNNAYRLR